MPNFPNELNKIYLKKKSNSKYKFDAHDYIVLSTLKYIVRQDIKTKLLSPFSSCHFSFVVPTSWDYKIRDELIRPFFVQIGLINENDDKGRISFFTSLESIFYYIQDSYYKENRKQHKLLINGKEYIMYGLDLSNNYELSVDLDLFSAQYPPTTASNDKYFIPKLLNSIHFTIPLLKETERGIKICMESRGFDIRSTRIKQIISVLLKEFFSLQVNATFK